MSTYDPSGAAARLHTESVDGYKPGKNGAGMCARWNYFAIGATPNLTPLAKAVDAWNYAPASARHPIGEATVVPKDHPVILGALTQPRWAGDKTYMDGDVVLSNGTGIGLHTGVTATDFPYLGVVGDTTIADRAIQTGHRPVLGYLTNWVGYDLTTPGVALAAADISTPLEEDDMPLSDVDKQWTHDEIVEILRAPEFASQLSAGKEVVAILSVQVIYRTYLGREADIQGLMTFVDYLLKTPGATVQGVIDSVTASAEYKAKNPTS